MSSTWWRGSHACTRTPGALSPPQAPVSWSLALSPCKAPGTCQSKSPTLPSLGWWALTLPPCTLLRSPWQFPGRHPSPQAGVPAEKLLSVRGHQSPGFLTWPHQRECWHSSQGCLPSDLFQPGKCDFRRTFSQNASPCAKTQVCSLGSLAPSSSQCDRNQSTPGIASIYSYKPSFTMLKYPFLAIVPVMPFPSSPFRPNPSSLTISLATLLEQAIEKMLEPLEFYQVDGTMDWCALLDCNLTCMKILSCRKTTLELFPTFTTSKGLTMMASVTPAPSPAREYVWKWQDFVHLHFCAGYQRSWLLCPKAEDLLELLKSEELWHER